MEERTCFLASEGGVSWTYEGTVRYPDVVSNPAMIQTEVYSSKTRSRINCGRLDGVRGQDAQEAFRPIRGRHPENPKTDLGILDLR